MTPGRCSRLFARWLTGSLRRRWPSCGPMEPPLPPLRRRRPGGRNTLLNSTKGKRWTWRKSLPRLDRAYTAPMC
eukprot:13537633-Alexandrium_andersonii.AAC.1